MGRSTGRTAWPTARSGCGACQRSSANLRDVAVVAVVVEVGEVDGPTCGLAVLGFDEREVVDPGRGHAVEDIGWLCGRFGMDVDLELMWDGDPEGPAVVADLERGEVERV